jgi:broad specificity phosphatase PhoE
MAIGVALALLLAQPGQVVQDLYYVRHAETVANATGKYNSQTLNAISDKGQQQIVALTKRLKDFRFDAIYVSPSARALKTIAPYLRDTRQTAEIWPELYECCHERGEARKQPAGPLRFGPKIEPPEVIAKYFRLAPGRERYVAVSNYQEGLRQVRMCADQVRKLNQRTVLLVGHSLMGARLLSNLLGREANIEIRNAALIRLQRLSNGTYRVANAAIP